MLRFLPFLLACFTFAATPPKSSVPEPSIIIPLWVDPADIKIAPSDLHVFINNQPARILKLLNPDSDLIILTVLDLTGDLALVEPAKESLIAEFDKLPPNVWVALLHAQEGLAVLSDPTSDRTAVSQQIESLPISGKAGLLTTLDQALTLADGMLHKADVRVAVLYITDSDVTNYREDLTNPVINSSDPHDLSRRFPDSLIRERASRLERQLAHTTTPLFIVHLQDRSSGLNQSYQSALSSLADSTAGLAVFCRSNGAIPEEISKMLNFIQASYFVTLARLPRPAPSLQLRVEWSSDDKSGSHLNYRSRILVRQR